MHRNIRIALGASLITFTIGRAIAATPQELENLAQLGTKNVEALKAPEYAKSRCLLSPTFGANYVTVAMSSDRTFSAGDTVSAIAGEPLDPTNKTTVRDVLMKHTPEETVPVNLKRAGRDLTVNARCTDAKPFYDLVLEASFAASKKDPSACADKLDEAARLHALAFPGAWLWFQCKEMSNKVTGPAASRDYYEIEKLGIEEAQSSADVLDHIRGQILTAVDLLRKRDAGFLADDLKQIYDSAVAKGTPPPSASNQ